MSRERRIIMRKKRITTFLLALIFSINLISADMVTDFKKYEEMGYEENSIWAGQAISNFLYNGIDAPNAMKPTKFKLAISREDFAELIVTYYAKVNDRNKANLKAGKSPFTDTKNRDVIKAYNLGLISGTSKTTFSPDKKLTREELAAILMRFCRLQKLDKIYNKKSLNKFADKQAVSSWAVDSLAYCVDHQYLQGDGYNVQPKKNATTEQVIAILDRIGQTNDWLKKSPDTYMNGFLIPNRLNYKIDDVAHTEGIEFYDYFSLAFNYKDHPDDDRNRESLRYILESKFPDNKEQIEHALDVIIKARYESRLQNKNVYVPVANYDLWIVAYPENMYLQFIRLYGDRDPNDEVYE